MPEGDQNNEATLSTEAMDDNQEEQVNATIMPVSNPYGSNMALLEHFCGQAPMDIACAEQERLAAPARTTRKRKNRDDEDVLISKGKGVDASDEDDDHIILEMEERNYEASRRVSAHTPDVIPNLLEDSASGSSSGKRARSDEDVVDKHPVGRLRISAEWNGLKKLQADYDEVQEQGNVSTIDRGAVGPVPPQVP
ncbi:hypothetical protein Bca52824_002444 [Brassica carinata]|uniref:Uncharacterized protein n=1 Tax=Brassica carinata TaxID=52824 RepID=A0A8X7WK73_BRACI|nr:hypothetical protein Bca52824_002444 [Brassica carinata]